MSKISINMDSLKPKREWKRHKVNPGTNTFRIGPPNGEEANGYPYKKWMVVWGMLDIESGRMRPFASSLTTEKRCPIMEYVEALQKKAEVLKGKLQAAGESDADIKEALKPITKVISTLRPKTVYAYNAIDKSGTVGILEVKATAQKKLKELMMSYIKDYNQDPTSLNSEADDSGLWFNFIRTGEGFDTEYDVQKVQMKTKVNGQTAFVDDRSPLPENVVENFNDLAYDLATIYQVKTYDQLREILLANIRLIVEGTDTVPGVQDALVPGFDDFADSPEISADAGTSQAAKSGTKSATSNGNSNTNAQQPKGKAAVVLKLDAEDGDDAEEVEAPVAKPATKRAATPAPSVEDEDIFALADNILNG